MYPEGLMVTWLFLKIVAMVTGKSEYTDVVHIQGGPIQKLNSKNASTIVMLTARFWKPQEITGWQFYAYSTQPFYASFWGREQVSGSDFTSKLLTYQKIVPQGKGFQEVRIPRSKRITAAAYSQLGIFYSRHDMDNDDSADDTGTVYVEQHAKKPHTPHISEDDFYSCVLETAPDKPLQEGYKFSAHSDLDTKCIIALAAVYEPDVEMRPIMGEYKDYAVKGTSTGIPLVTVDHQQGTICFSPNNKGLDGHWGNQTCQRIHDNDPDYMILESFPIDIDEANKDLHNPLPPPILFNPDCQEDKKLDMFMQDVCKSQNHKCDTKNVRFVMCARKSDLEKLKRIFVPNYVATILRI